MTVLPWLRRNRWSFAAIGVLALWAALDLATSRFSLQNLSGVASSASFLAVVALGQMFAVATGGGNIDLSVPSVITLSAFVTMILSGGTDAGLALALPAVVLVGLAVGAVNAFLILRVRIPAIIATLAVGYVLDTAVLITNRGFTTFGVSPALHLVAAGRVFGVPLILVVAVLLAGAASAVIHRTGYGRSLMAVGQNAVAADLAGARVGRITTAAFMISGVLAALDGALLSAHAGGAFLGMGKPYLLESVGAVVVGGTLIFGGSATPLGTLLGSVLLVLIVTTMQIAGLAGGVQDVMQGGVIIAVLLAAGAGASRRTA
ncbi:ABC transporter permease [Acidiphilium multivorum]|uniref:ABC transporter permease n=1 Tax=Acidiphilium multivorum TaxID=62140 RepID=UPI001F4C40BE|nr:ABC transporter permease [Acidiphilium multivorum]UNC12756.1 ABC transporter permease [Acidiphilium multivorum]